MAFKIKLLLIPIILFILSRPEIKVTSNDQALAGTVYLPIISYNITGWIGPYGGTVIDIVYDPTNPQIVYAGSYGSGVFKSLDGGHTWSSISEGLTNLYIYSLAIDPQHPSTLYAGTYHGQVYKTIDGGKSWKWSGNGMQADAIVYSIAVDPYEPENLYAATRGDSTDGHAPWNGVVYRTVDAGDGWTPSLVDVGGANVQDWVYCVVVNLNGHNQVYAASHEHGPLRSDDYGSTWHYVNNGIDDLSARAMAINPQPEYATTLYLGVWHFDSIYKSLNNGSSWLLANDGKSNVKVYSVAIDPVSTETVYLASFSYGILKTTNGADNWQYAGLLSDQIYSIAIDPRLTSDLLAGTAGDGIYRSIDGSSTWQHSNAGMNNAMVTAQVNPESNSKKMYASVYGAGVYQTDDRGQSWQEFNAGLTDKWVHSLELNPGNPNQLYALTDTGGLFKNDLSGNLGWVKAGSGLPLTTQPSPAFPAGHPFATVEMQEFDYTQQSTFTGTLETTTSLLTMAYAPSNPLIAYIGTNGQGVQKSSDGGASWQAAGLGGNTIYSIAVDPYNPNLLYAATNYPGSMKISANGGNSWANANLPFYFYALSASPSEPGTVYAGTSAGLYLYQNGTFTLLGLSGQTVTAIALDPHGAGVIYAGTTLGAYYSIDSGQSWKPVNSQLNGITIQSINFDQSKPDVVYFATTTHGIFLTEINF
jgi:photosystem II stability/assembly factor-like uncharacterized protein